MSLILNPWRDSVQEKKKIAQRCHFKVSAYIRQKSVLYIRTCIKILPMVFVCLRVTSL